MARYQLEGFSEESWQVQNSFFYREIRRTNRNMLIVLAVLLLVLSLLLIYPFAVKLYISREAPSVMQRETLLSLSRKDVSSYLPFTTTFENSDDYKKNAHLKRLAYAEGLQFVFTIEADERLPSNIVPVENSVPTFIENTGDSLSYIDYVVLQIGDRYLLTKEPVGETGLRLSGMLAYLPDDLLTIVSDASGLPAEKFIPAIFDTGREIFATLKTDLLFWGILFLIWLSFFIPLIRRMLDPTRHEAYRKMYVYAGSTEENIKALDRELAGEGNLKSFRKIITPSWAVTRRFFSFEAKMKDRR